MNNLLALMHDTAKENASISQLVFVLLNTNPTDEQKTFIAAINTCNERIKTTMDNFYIANQIKKL